MADQSSSSEAAPNNYQALENNHNDDTRLQAPIASAEAGEDARRRNLAKRDRNMVKRMRVVLPTATDPDVPRDIPLWGHALRKSTGNFLDSEWAEYGDRLVDAARERIDARLIEEARWTLWNAWRWVNPNPALWAVVPERLDDDGEDETDDEGPDSTMGDEALEQLQRHLENTHIAEPDTKPTHVKRVETDRVEVKRVDITTPTIWGQLWARRYTVCKIALVLMLLAVFVLHGLKKNTALDSRDPELSPDLVPPPPSLDNHLKIDNLKLQPIIPDAIPHPTPSTVAGVVNQTRNETVLVKALDAAHESKLPTPATRTTLASTSHHQFKDHPDFCPLQKPAVASFDHTATDVCPLADRQLVIGKALSFVAPFDLSANWPPFRYVRTDPPERYLDLLGIYDVDLCAFLFSFLLYIGETVLTNTPWILGEDVWAALQVMVYFGVFSRFYLCFLGFLYVEYGIVLFRF